MYDGDFSELMEAVSVIEKTYSNKNEWLGTFKKETFRKNYSQSISINGLRKY